MFAHIRKVRKLATSNYGVRAGILPMRCAKGFFYAFLCILCGCITPFAGCNGRQSPVPEFDSGKCATVFFCAPVKKPFIMSNSKKNSIPECQRICNQLAELTLLIRFDGQMSKHLRNVHNHTVHFSEMDIHSDLKDSLYYTDRVCKILESLEEAIKKYNFKNVVAAEL